MEAVWIEPSQRDHAQTLGYTVVDTSTVIATHLSHVIQSHAHELLGHEEVQHLLDTLAKTAPKLVEDLVPRLLPPAPWSARCRACSASGYRSATCGASWRRSPSTRARRRTRARCSPRCASRSAARSSKDIVGLSYELPVITLEPELEEPPQGSLASGGVSPGLEPGLAERLQRRLAESAQRQELSGEPAVLLVQPQLRQTLARFMRSSVPSMHVLAWNEIPDSRKVRLVTAVGR